MVQLVYSLLLDSNDLGLSAECGVDQGGSEEGLVGLGE